MITIAQQMWDMELRPGHFSLVNQGDGSPSRPFRITHETYVEIQRWLGPLEAKLDGMDKDEQEAFIADCRAEAKRRWPWWFPHCHVHIA